jgi:hypothetical protein
VSGKRKKLGDFELPQLFSFASGGGKEAVNVSGEAANAAELLF